MTRIQNVYRRGAVYWFRANLRLFPARSIDIRVSLRTTSARDARHLGAVARAASGGVQTMLNHQLATSGALSDSAITAIGRKAYDEFLGS